MLAVVRRRTKLDMSFESRSLRRFLASTRSISTSSLVEIRPNPSLDFVHHRPGVSRLNHASFGATPAPVSAHQDFYRQLWLEQPDELYFTGKLHKMIRESAQTTAITLLPLDSKKRLPDDQVCLVENSTVAACAVAYRWRNMIQTGDVVIYFDLAYKACIHILKEYCELQGATMIPIQIPFLCESEDIILDSVRQQLQHLADTGRSPRFAFLDHVASQPAVLLPIQKIIELVRNFSADDNEICVDGAHAVGSVPKLDISSLQCDFYFTNLHKWAFCPPTATIMWSKYLPEMRHPIVSWAWGQGLAEESLFPGTRDFSSFLAAPAAVEYLQKWSLNGQNSQQYCHDRVIQAAAKLRRDWNVDHLEQNGDMESSLVATQAMVRLPDELIVQDVPGHVSRGVRTVLREDYGVEASVGKFGDIGAYVRLSYAVYNTDEDIQKLSNAVIDIIEHQ